MSVASDTIGELLGEVEFSGGNADGTTVA